MSKGISLTYVGHSAWRIRTGQYEILIDPFVTGNPLAAFTPDQLQPTHILVSHGHGDHIGDTIPLARRSGAQVITCFEIVNWLRDQGIENLHAMSIGGAHDFDFGRVKLTPALHGSSLPDGRYGGQPAGLLLSIGGHTIYHAGDTALFSDMRLIGQGHRIDVGMVPIGDNFTMGIDDAAAAVALLDPRIAIPMHYNTFDVIRADPEEFRSRVEAAGHKAMVLSPGESYDLGVAEA